MTDTIRKSLGNVKGVDGNVYYPVLTETETGDIELSWTKISYDSEESLPDSINIKGEQGRQGVQGIQGNPAVFKYTVSGSSSLQNINDSQDGDMAYIDQGVNEGDFYQFFNDTWNYIGNIKGSQGEPGVLYNEEGLFSLYVDEYGDLYVSESENSNGEFYLDEQTKDLYYIPDPNILREIKIGNIAGPAGKSLEYDWDGTKLGIRQEGEAEFTYVDLKVEVNDSDLTAIVEELQKQIQQNNEISLEDLELEYREEDKQKDSYPSSYDKSFNNVNSWKIKLTFQARYLPAYQIVFIKNDNTTDELKLFGDSGIYFNSETLYEGQLGYWKEDRIIAIQKEDNKLKITFPTYEQNIEGEETLIYTLTNEYTRINLRNQESTFTTYEVSNSISLQDCIRSIINQLNSQNESVLIVDELPDEGNENVLYLVKQ